MIQLFLVFSDWAVLFLRVVLALILIRHGLPKLKNLKETASWFQGAGFKPGSGWAFVAGITEAVAGLAILIGFLTQVFALIVVLEFIVILVKFRGDKMFTKESELDWLVLAAALILVTLGSGVLSLERYLDLILYY